MVYFLFDNPADKKNMEFLKEYDTASFKLLFPKEQCLSVKSMIKVCNECIRKSSNGDTLICWYDFMGILCWWLCRISFRKRNIVALNILLKNKKSLKNKIARILYRPALKSKNMVATVTSEEYGEAVNKLLGIKKQYILLHDIYHGGYDIGYEGRYIPALKESMVMYEVSVESVVSHNGNLRSASPRGKGRDRFFQQYKENGYGKIEMEYEA